MPVQISVIFPAMVSAPILLMVLDMLHVTFIAADGHFSFELWLVLPLTVPHWN